MSFAIPLQIRAISENGKEIFNDIQRLRNELNDDASMALAKNTGIPMDRLWDY